MSTMEEFRAHQRWIQQDMPMLISFNLAPDASDDWLRRQCRGIDAPLPRLQQVVVQGAAEADRVMVARLTLRRQFSATLLPSVNLMYLVIANLARRIEEWATARLDRHERHIVTLIKEQW